MGHWLQVALVYWEMANKWREAQINHGKAQIN